MVLGKSIIIPFINKIPKIDNSAFIAPNAVIAGDVTIGESSGIWFGAVIRGDVNFVKIGNKTNIQDGTVIHVSRKNEGRTIIGNNVTIGHSCLLHACTIEDNSFIGMQSLIMDNAIIESESMVAAGSLVTSGTKVLSGELWGGRPAKFMRKIKPEEKEFIKENITVYENLASEYKKQLSI